jgi:hypothetical protein
MREFGVAERRRPNRKMMKGPPVSEALLAVAANEPLGPWLGAS